MILHMSFLLRAESYSIVSKPNLRSELSEHSLGFFIFQHDLALVSTPSKKASVVSVGFPQILATTLPWRSK